MNTQEQVKITDDDFKFNGTKIKNWIRSILDHNTTVVPVEDYGDIASLRLTVFGNNMLISKYKQVLATYEAITKSYDCYIVPLAAFKTEKEAKIPLLCRVEIRQTVIKFIYYGIIDLNAYKNITNIHMYMRDNATYEVEEAVYKPEKEISLIEEDISGLSKAFITKQDYDAYWNDPANKFFKQPAEINIIPYKIHVIINPITERIIRDPDVNIRTIDKEILDTFIHFKTYGNTYEILSSIIYNN